VRPRAAPPQPAACAPAWARRAASAPTSRGQCVRGASHAGERRARGGGASG
jgi:hypothetical protein